MQLLISQRPLFAGLAFPNDRRLIPAMRCEMSIQTIFRDIEFAADKPLRERRFPFENFSPALLPGQFVGFARPKFLRMLDRLAIHPAILLEAFDPRLLRKFLRRFKDALF